MATDTPVIYRPLTATSGRYANEEVRSTYGYPAAYHPKNVADQIMVLRAFFSNLGPQDKDFLVRVNRHELPLPNGAEFFGAIPRWQAIAPSYNEATEIALAKLAEERPFINWRLGQLGSKQLRRTKRTSEALAKLASQQNDADILIVPVQFGKRYAGRSVRRAREVFTSNEFGLGGFETACLLLTHPERLVSYEDLWIDCPGDEYRAFGRFGYAPCFGFLGGLLGFGTFWTDIAVANYGSASGFLPQ
jgi:hypothetical protein